MSVFDVSQLVSSGWFRRFGERVSPVQPSSGRARQGNIMVRRRKNWINRKLAHKKAIKDENIRKTPCSVSRWVCDTSLAKHLSITHTQTRTLTVLKVFPSLRRKIAPPERRNRCPTFGTGTDYFRSLLSFCSRQSFPRVPAKGVRLYQPGHLCVSEWGRLGPTAHTCRA